MCVHDRTLTTESTERERTIMVHNITLDRWGETFHFASIDGQDWLPLNRPLAEGEEDEFSATLDGDGNMQPLRFARRWFMLQSPLDADMTVNCDCAQCRPIAEHWDVVKETITA